MSGWMREHPVYTGYRIARDGTVIGRSGKVLKPNPDGQGYAHMNMCLPDNGRKSVRVHRLVCEAWHGLRPSLRHVVAHRDGNRSNNHADNLRWATFEENEADKIQHGTRQVGQDHHAARLTDDKVREARAMRRTGTSFAKIATAFGVTKATVQQAIKGETWRHVQ